MLIGASIVLVIMLLGSVATIFAFSWAATHQQFENLDKAAESIFDEDEPVGTPTDASLTATHES